MGDITMAGIRKKIIIISLFIFFLIISLPHSSNATTLMSNWAPIPPTIDGKATSGEWDTAYMNSVLLYDFMGNPEYTIYLWAMNDAEYLYFRIQWTDLTHDEDGFVIFFDEDNNGNWANFGVENAFMGYRNASGFYWLDGYADLNDLIIDAGTQDGAANLSYNGFVYLLEIAIPIGSTDQEDIQPGAGSTIGIALMNINHSTILDTCPYNTLNNQSTVTLQLAAQPSNIGSPWDSFVELVAVIVVIVIAHRSRKTIRKNNEFTIFHSHFFQSKN